MKKIKIGLLPRIIIAIILGIAIGTVFPAPLVRIFVTFNGIFSEFLNFSIPLIIVMTALVLAFTLGLGLASLNSDALKNVARDFQEIIVRMISAVILPLLPLYIFGIFLNMTHSGQVYAILMVFIKIIGVIFILHIFLLVFQYSIRAQKSV